MFRQSKRITSGRKNFDNYSAKDKNLYVQDGDLLSSVYSQRLNLYDIPPLNEITLEEFETWAIDRLKILIEIESCQLRGRNFKEISAHLKPILAKLLPLTSNSKDSSLLISERKKDHYSHFILRLAFCRSEELRARFVKAETILFKIRYDLLSIQEQKNFVKSIDLPWQFIDNDEKLKFEKQLYDSCYNLIKLNLGASNSNEEIIKKTFENEIFLKVPFKYVLNLVSSRSVFINDGYCYVPQFLQLNLITSEFSQKLDEKLILTMKTIPRLDEDDRLLPVLNNLSNGYVLDEFLTQKGSGSLNRDSDELNASNLNQVSEFMPLCMQNLMYGLKKHNHLKYNGRQQLGRFIKELGLPLNEALLFWKNSLKGLNFEKDYAYNIKHTYGAVGGRIKYRGMNCTNIMNQPKPHSSEYHGCFYKENSIDDIFAKLKMMQMTDEQINQITDSVREGKYQIACTMVLESKCGGKTMPIVTHPNFYFEEAYKYSKDVSANKES
ncbi:hypothetical protein PACTADRAFT_50205 [Pachysolen tannophilus NRRL Y-2460]|uniref:DNA primase large subunit n=1 Tax=Pachysolen tannophilus NRRL Y-2460 TaxID=669874 RepID=A0A1E4TUR4_PACTA|nr:hypothetical protein PACTADRAFT_50205 [Pachysolen tannophilus NRRL Y-2460]